MRKRTVLSLAVVFGCAACGSVKSAQPDGSSNAIDSGGGGKPDASKGNADANLGPDANPGNFSLALGETQLTIPYESSQTDNISIARAGNVGAITLTAQVPTGITVSFSPSMVPTGTSTAQMTVSVAPGAANGMNAVQVTGTASGGLSHSAMLQVTAQPITINGTVRGQVAGVTVALAGGSAVTSDNSGHFTFANVAPPYDVYTIFNNTVIYYQGLTRPDPTVDAALLNGVLVPPSGTITGTLKGAGVNTANPVIIAWSVGGLTTKFSTGSSYSFSGSSYGTTQKGTLYGLQWTTNASKEPISYPAYGTANATITAGATTTVNLSASAPSTATVSGIITGPTGYNAPIFTLTQKFGGTSRALWQGSVSTINAKIPVISAGTTTLYALAKNAGGALSELDFPALNSNTDVTFSMPTAAVLSAPANNASGVSTTTPFQWAPPTKTVNELVVSTNGAAYEIITTKSKITIPDVPQLPLPSGKSFAWHVENYGPLTSTDDTAGAIDLRKAKPNDFAPGSSHFDTLSLSRTFTSQ